jgi:hypothetical protein
MPRISVTAVLVVAVLIVVGGYAALTYLRVVASFPVSFTIGAESKTVEFDLPLLHDEMQVEVRVTSGTALWTAQVVSGNETVWSHSASQGGQTTYQSEWVSASPVHYKLVFRTIGFGSLEGEVKVSTKGGPW